jgi:hypothetical protein
VVHLMINAARAIDEEPNDGTGYFRPGESRRTSLMKPDRVCDGKLLSSRAMTISRTNSYVIYLLL